MNQPVSGGQNDKFAVSKLLPDSNISEIISDLCSTVSFIVLDLFFEFTANIRTLELTHVLGTVSCSSGKRS